MKNESGHVKNVANFENLISFCAGYGTNYNPANAAIKISALQAKHAESITALEAVNLNLPPWINAVNEREILFEPVSKLITRVINAVEASDVPQQTIDDVKTITRKLQGRRASPKKAPEPPNPETPEVEPGKSYSVSQMSYDNRIEFMQRLIDLLKSIPAYNPNETDLSVITLSAMVSNMKILNTAVINAYTPLSNARINRDQVLYNGTSGIIPLALSVKAYVKSVFGASSPHYKQVRALSFKKIGN